MYSSEFWNDDPLNPDWPIGSEIMMRNAWEDLFHEYHVDSLSSLPLTKRKRLYFFASPVFEWERKLLSHVYVEGTSGKSAKTKHRSTYLWQGMSTLMKGNIPFIRKK